MSAAPTTTSSPATDLLAFLAGFVAAEGHFSHVPATGAFAFTVQLGADDEAMCRLFATVLGVGRTRRYPARQPGYQDEVHYTVRRRAHLDTVIVPFLDTHLPPSHKRTQFQAWRAAMQPLVGQHSGRRRRADLG